MKKEGTFIFFVDMDDMLTQKRVWFVSLPFQESVYDYIDLQYIEKVRFKENYWTKGIISSFSSSGKSYSSKPKNNKEWIC